MASVFGRLFIKKIAAGVGKAVIGAALDKRKYKKEWEKREGIFNSYIREVKDEITDPEEIAALQVFLTFPLDQTTEYSTKEFRKEVESGEFDDFELRRWKAYHKRLSGMTKNPKIMNGIARCDAKIYLLETTQKLQQEPNLKERVFDHFYKLNQRMND